MKRLFFFATVCFCAIILDSSSLWSQALPSGISINKKEGFKALKNFNVLKDGDRVLFLIDYTDAVFKGYSQEEISSDYGKDEWDREITSLRDVFIYTMEEEFGRRSILFFKNDNPNIKYKLILKVISIDKRGNLTGNVFLYDYTDDSHPIASTGLHGKGGRIGSFMNLMGDGHRSAAESLGKFLRGKIRRN